jgi:hypothetical protein
MTDDADRGDGNDVRITVEAPSVDAIADAFELEAPDEGEAVEPEHPEELRPVLSTLADVYRGVAAATEEDSRGRSRKMVREYAGRDDLESDEVGHLLRVLEAEGLVVQDGNRWRLAGVE